MPVVLCETNSLFVDCLIPRSPCRSANESLLPQDRELTITLFGSAPLQIAVDPMLTSADVDVFSDYEPLDDIVHKAGLGTNQADFYIQVSSELNFRTSQRWKGRTSPRA